jgi:hypothetical protein
VCLFFLFLLQARHGTFRRYFKYLFVIRQWRPQWLNFIIAFWVANNVSNFLPHQGWRVILTRKSWEGIRNQKFQPCINYVHVNFWVRSQWKIP